jgi:hypothetical protein
MFPRLRGNKEEMVWIQITTGSIDYRSACLGVHWMRRMCLGVHWMTSCHWQLRALGPFNIPELHTSGMWHIMRSLAVTWSVCHQEG